MSTRLITLMLAVSVAFLAAGTAHATTFEGSCELSGDFSLTGGTYDIAGDEFDAGCSGSLNGVDGGYLVRYTSSGTLSGDCGGGIAGAGTGRLEFFTVDIFQFPQSPEFVDTLDVVYETGGLTSDGRLYRVLRGTVVGLAAERGRIHACGTSGSRYAGQFRTIARLGDGN